MECSKQEWFVFGNIHEIDENKSLLEKRKVKIKNKEYEGENE